MVVASINQPVRELLADLQAQGFSVEVRGIRVVISPACRITDQLAERIRKLRGPLASVVRLIANCERCGSDEVVDVPVHDGLSLRRDCATCGATLGFPNWYGSNAIEGCHHA